MFKHLRSVGLVALVLLGAGCVKDVGSIKVDGVCLPTEDCAFSSGGCDGFALSRPVIDVAQTITLQLYVNVTNQMLGEAEAGGINTHDAYADRISTSYSVLDPGFSLAGSGSTTIGTIPAESTSTIKMYVIDEDAGTALRALAIPAWNAATQNYVDMVAHVSVEGHLVDGTEYKTEPYDLAFRVCRGCLPVCTGGAVCPPGVSGQTPIICEASTVQVSCVAAGTFCGSNPNVTNGDPNTLYACAAAGATPNGSPCPTTCNTTADPDACD